MEHPKSTHCATNTLDGTSTAYIPQFPDGEITPAGLSMNPIETIESAIFIKPMSDDITSPVDRHHDFITLFPKAIRDRWGVHG